MISVIIPIHKNSEGLLTLRTLICEKKDIELIVIIQNQALLPEDVVFNNERFVFSNEVGRGNNLVKGIERSIGDSILICHADTLLPKNWNELIHSVMQDEKYLGGCFHLKFDRTNFFLELLIKLSNCLFLFTGEMWGDRAVFAKGDLVRGNVNLLNVPIMEDVILSHFLKRQGKVKMLREYVITSSETFYRCGVIKHTLKILYCRVLHLFGKDLKIIYQKYYS
ncbi:MAG: hypothetical protein H0W73_15955 [Bacteroidetes bacterium]|nr:hypothetical protein [Bacteroidota bacterium]